MPAMLRVILVDDERLALQRMKQLLRIHHDLEIVGEAHTVTEAAVLVEKKHPDAVFLDVRMPGGSGFELTKQCSPVPKIIFVSAHAEHAPLAFDVDAVDYLMKPVRVDRLAIAIQRLLSACRPGSSGENAPPVYALTDRICLRTPGKTVIVPVGKIVALEAEADFTRVLFSNQPPLLICRALGIFENELPSPPFCRVDRSLMLNTSAITAQKQESRDLMQISLEGVEQTFLLRRTGMNRLKRAQ